MTLLGMSVTLDSDLSNELTLSKSSSAPPSQSKSNVSERLTQAETPLTQTDPEQDHSCLDEQAQVKERYEEINRYSRKFDCQVIMTSFSARLLGSMFLSRRRQLGLGEPYPS